jgi:hypothetical protein
MAIGRLQAMLWTSALCLCLSGCHSAAEPKYTTWAHEPKEFVPRQNSKNAFDTYAQAALDVEQSAKSYLERVSFFPGQRLAVQDKIKLSVSSVAKATQLTCNFEFVPHRPFSVAPFQRGWRLIGRVFQWNVDDACSTGDYDTAIQNAVIGSTFGFDLTAGGATDASLGLAIADDIRKSMAKYLIKMSPKQLDTLAKGMKNALSRKPEITDSIKNERENMLQSVQYLQDRLKADDLKSLQQNMGHDVTEALRYMDQIRNNEPKRNAFFSELEKAGEDEFDLVEHDAGLSTSARTKTKTEYTGSWKKLPKHIFGSARPLLDINDSTVARTRLLILYAELLKLGREKKPYPETLDSFSKDVTIDPFSGAPFIYHADKAEFSLYSVGKNGRDDGGDTDDTYTAPDLKLECPSF